MEQWSKEKNASPECKINTFFQKKKNRFVCTMCSAHVCIILSISMHANQIVTIVWQTQNWVSFSKANRVYFFFYLIHLHFMVHEQYYIQHFFFEAQLRIIYRSPLIYRFLFVFFTQHMSTQKTANTQTYMLDRKNRDGGKYVSILHEIMISFL